MRWRRLRLRILEHRFNQRSEDHCPTAVAFFALIRHSTFKVFLCLTMFSSHIDWKSTASISLTYTLFLFPTLRLKKSTYICRMVFSSYIDWKSTASIPLTYTLFLFPTLRLKKSTYLCRMVFFSFIYGKSTASIPLTYKLFLFPTLRFKKST